MRNLCALYEYPGKVKCETYTSNSFTFFNLSLAEQPIHYSIVDLAKIRQTIS